MVCAVKSRDATKTIQIHTHVSTTKTCTFYISSTKKSLSKESTVAGTKRSIEMHHAMQVKLKHVQPPKLLQSI